MGFLVDINHSVCRVTIAFKTCNHFIIWKKKVSAEIKQMRAMKKSMPEVDSQSPEGSFNSTLFRMGEIGNCDIPVTAVSHEG